MANAGFRGFTRPRNLPRIPSQMRRHYRFRINFGLLCVHSSFGLTPSRVIRCVHTRGTAWEWNKETRQCDKNVDTLSILECRRQRWRHGVRILWFSPPATERRRELFYLSRKIYRGGGACVNYVERRVREDLEGRLFNERVSCCEWNIHVTSRSLLAGRLVKYLVFKHFDIISNLEVN